MKSRAWCNGLVGVRRALAAMAVILLLASVAAASDSGLIRYTLHGAVKGVEVNNGTSLAWLGIPYAKPPLGDLRWTRPQKPDSWDGILDTMAYPNRAPQPAGSDVAGDEDCLYLNIWRPATMESNLPVMFFIHGGSNQTGSGESLPGDRLAVQANCVVVTVNYRLGALGWLHHPLLRTGDAWNDSGNWGLLDCARALEWVRDNILAFGGNPDNVTISGSSAGGRDCLALMISPIAKGLFHKAMIFCGGLTVADPELSTQIADNTLRQVLVSSGRACNDDEAAAMVKEGGAELLAYLRTVPAEHFVKAMKPSQLRMGNFPHLFRDGVVIPENAFDTLATSDYDPIPLIVGAADREFITFSSRDPVFGDDFANQTLTNNPDRRDLFIRMNDYASRFYSGFNLDTVMDKVLQNSGQPKSYAYRIGWGRDPEAVEPPYNEMLGGSHTCDSDFMTGHWTYFIKNTYPQYYTDANLPGRLDLSRNVMAYFRNFLYTGDPNGEGLAAWEPYETGKERFIHFSADANKAKIGMVNGHMPREEALKQVHELPYSEYVILEQLVKGRFFFDIDY